MSGYWKMLALMYEAAAAGCRFDDKPKLGVLKWRNSCSECEEGRKCPAQVILFQAFAIDAGLEADGYWSPERDPNLVQLPDLTRQS